MLARRLRRASINPTLGQRLVLIWVCDTIPAVIDVAPVPIEGWANVVDGATLLIQRWFNFLVDLDFSWYTSPRVRCESFCE